MCLVSLENRDGMEPGHGGKKEQPWSVPELKRDDDEGIRDSEVKDGNGSVS